MGHPGLGVREEGGTVMKRQLLAPIGGTGSLTGFTVIVMALAVCGLVGLVP